MASRESPRAGMSLERRLPLLFSVLLAAVVAVFAIAAYRETRGSTMVAAEERLQRAAAQLAALSANSGVQRAVALRAIANNDTVRAALRPGGPADAATRLFARLIVADSLAEAMALLDARGTLRVHAGVADDDASRAALGDLQRPVPRGDSLRTSVLFAHGDRISSWSLLPIRDEGRLVALLAQRRRLPDNPRTEEQVRGLLGQDVTLHFANVDGGLWTGPRGRPLDAPFPVPVGSGVFHAVTRAGQPVLGAIAPVPGSEIAIVISLPESLVLARPRVFLRRMLLLGGLLVLAGVVVVKLGEGRAPLVVEPLPEPEPLSERPAA